MSTCSIRNIQYRPNLQKAANVSKFLALKRGKFGSLDDSATLEFLSESPKVTVKLEQKEDTQKYHPHCEIKWFVTEPYVRLMLFESYIPLCLILAMQWFNYYYVPVQLHVPELSHYSATNSVAFFLSLVVLFANVNKYMVLERGPESLISRF
jgi:hypothetical protein